MLLGWNLLKRLIPKSMSRTKEFGCFRWWINLRLLNFFKIYSLEKAGGTLSESPADRVNGTTQVPKGLKADFYFNSALPFGTTGHNTSLPLSWFWKGESFLGIHITGDSALPRRPLRSLGSGSCRAEWQIPWTSAFQVLPPDQVWAFALSLPKYMSLLPTMSALSQQERHEPQLAWGHRGPHGAGFRHSSHRPEGWRGRLLHVSTK